MVQAQCKRREAAHVQVLNVCKPQGLTPYGRRRQQEDRASATRRPQAAGG